MSEQERPAPKGYNSWQAYWKEQRMPWRTEPEINEKRQQYLAVRKAIQPDIKHGIYPFRNENGRIKLDRADVEWLLATHEIDGMQGPTDWEDSFHRRRVSIDLRGACLDNINLDYIPFANLRGGLAGTEFDLATEEERAWAGIHMKRVTLRYAQLEGSVLTFAHMEGVVMKQARLNAADMYRAHLASEPPADLSGCILDEATVLRRVNLCNARGIGPRLQRIHWSGAQLSGVDWSNVRMLEDEHRARSRQIRGKSIDKGRRIHEYERAISAYLLLVNALRSQGLHEQADRFAYRARVCQRVRWRLRGNLPRYFGSFVIAILSGYGYRPLRSVFIYLFVVLGFAAAYFALTNFAITPFLPSHSSPLAWYEAIVLSLGAFHGRGLFPSGLSLGDPVVILAAIEAIFGLIIEITFIATFTQRFFAR